MNNYVHYIIILITHVAISVAVFDVPTQDIYLPHHDLAQAAIVGKHNMCFRSKEILQKVS